ETTGMPPDDPGPERAAAVNGDRPHPPLKPVIPPTPELVAAWLGLFVGPDQVVELRALKVSRPGYMKKHTESGFFDADHLLDMAHEAIRLTKHAPGVYFTLNPVNPDLLSRICNRVRPVEDNETTANRDVIRRRWVLIDCDPRRTPGVSSSRE